MLSIIGVAPHPPLIIPAIGRTELSKVERTVEGMQVLCRRIKEAKPEILIIITPHGRIAREGPTVLTDDQLTGHFGRFGFPEIRIAFQTDKYLIELLESETATESIKPVLISGREHSIHGGEALDHGAMVPLYYLQQAGVSVPGLHLTIGLQPYHMLYQFGRSLRRAVEKRGLPAAVLASGDLSHRLIPNAPGGYSPRGAEFDRLLVDYLLKGDVEKILQFDQGLVGEAGECGLRSFVIALGMFADEEFSTDVISYEGPFGVGYLVASLHPVGGGKAILDQSSRDRIPEKQTALNPARLARAVLSCYLEEGCVPKTPHQLSPEYERRAGVFVSLKKGGYLRGCIGTVVPVKDNLAEEIAANTVSAATKDPRFPPVTLEELADISVSVDILGSMERVKKETELDAKKYGVLVRSGLRSGLLLPDLEGVNTVAEQLDIARRKAGIASDERVELYRFGITRYSEC